MFRLNHRYASLKSIWGALLVLFFFPSAKAQWQTQTIPLQAGWNSIYLHLDATHASISSLVGSLPIEEIWLWSPSVNEAQFVLSPDAPSGSKSRWMEWRNTLGDASSKLKSLIPNAAYLVRLQEGAEAKDWNLKGRPVPPQYNWTTSGLNFVGFPVNPTASWNLESYFLKADNFLSSATFYQYTSGNLGRNNPAKVFGQRTTALTRGRAFWIDTGDGFNQFYGPFQVTLQNFKGFQFGTEVQSSRMRLRNMTSSPLTIRLSTLAGETSPEGEALEGDIQSSFMIRANKNNDTQRYAFEACPCTDVEVVLEPRGTTGQQLEVVVGLRRANLAGAPGSTSSGIFRVEDSLSQSRVDIPIRAQKGAFQGLWVGQAMVNKVSRANDSTKEDTSNSAPLRFIMHQEEVAISFSEDASAGVGLTLGITPAPKPLFVGEVVHLSNGSTFTLTQATAINETNVTGDLVGDSGILNGAQGNISRLRMLQRIHVGMLPGSIMGLATSEASLDASSLSSAKRISSVHLPFSENNQPWAVSGAIEHGATLTATVLVDHGNHVANPFVHTYHPDHDNLNADFSATLPRGVESFGFERSMTFELAQSGSDFNQIVSMGNTISGNYRETITLKGAATEGPPNENVYHVEGPFQMVRISPIGSLTLP